jgi:hypothetical protein
MNGLLRQAEKLFKRHGATALTCIGGVGVIATTVTAVKATPKAMRIIEEAERRKGEKLTNVEKVKMAGPKYVPTILLGVGTLVCIFGANVMNKKHQATLVSAYALIDSSYKEYKHKLKELFGQEAHEEIVKSIAIEKAKDVGITAECLCANNCLTDEEACGDPVLFYDEYGERYFETTIEQVITAEYHLNRNLVLRGYVTLNEFYSFLGLGLTERGDLLGWAIEDGLYWIDFNHVKAVMDDGLECHIIETPWGPSTEWQEHYY